MQGQAGLPNWTSHEDTCPPYCPLGILRNVVFVTFRTSMGIVVWATLGQLIDRVYKSVSVSVYRFNHTQLKLDPLFLLYICATNPCRHFWVTVSFWSLC